MSDTDNIIALFNRTELREGESIIDNRDSTIAKELGLNLSVTTKCITKYLDEKFRLINDNNEEESSCTESEQLRIALNEIRSLKDKLNTERKRYKTIETKKSITKEGIDTMALCKKMILQGCRTKEIYVALNFFNYYSLYHLVEHETGMKYSEYKKQLLKLVNKQ